MVLVCHIIHIIPKAYQLCTKLWFIGLNASDSRSIDLKWWKRRKNKLLSREIHFPVGKSRNLVPILDHNSSTLSGLLIIYQRKGDEIIESFVGIFEMITLLSLDEWFFMTEQFDNLGDQTGFRELLLESLVGISMYYNLPTFNLPTKRRHKASALSMRDKLQQYYRSFR